MNDSVVIVLQRGVGAGDRLQEECQLVEHHGPGKVRSPTIERQAKPDQMVGG